MSETTISLVGSVAMALVFDHTNGFHDSAHSIATVVATRVLRPRFAVAWAALFNFVAFVFVGTAVANTVGQAVKSTISAWPWCSRHLRSTGDKLPIPPWVILVAEAAIALGTLSGGWRIVRTMGMCITRLQPVDGFAAETGAAIALFGSTAVGAPVSTTHTVAGAITGVGGANRSTTVDWRIFGRVALAWLVRSRSPLP